MKLVVHEHFKENHDEIHSFIHDFDNQGEVFGNQDRNSLKLFKLGTTTVNAKSFKIPNIVNKVAYRFFRGSKAERSYTFANKLTEYGIGTPQPIAYAEEKSALFFGKSFYLSEQQDCDLTYRELTTDLNYPDHEIILRAFTRFTFQLHEKGVNFLDHSPGNTLIKKTSKGYDFYLVDLNRMRFEVLSFEDRIRNFAKLTVHKSMIETMSDEYAQLIGKPYNDVFNLMWKFTNDFQEKFHRRRRWKKRLFFWKNYD